MKFLVAEDDKTTLKLLEHMLQKAGHECVLATDGKQALDILLQPDAPRIAILDWEMPGCTGVEICREVRSRHREEYLYLIILTGRTTEEEVLTGLSSGADDYLKKPIKRDELRARLGIAERIVAEDQKLRTLLMRHKSVLEAIPSALIVTDESDVVVDWNDQASQIFGIPCEIALGSRLTQLTIDWEWSEILLGIATCWDSGKTSHLTSIRAFSQDSERAPRILDVTITRLTRKRGSFPAVLIVINDVTQQRDLQEKLFVAQKLESVGRLSAGVAHEINTPSQFVKNNLLFVQRCLGELAPHLCQTQRPDHSVTASTLTGEMAEAVDDALNGINRVSEIVRAIGNYVHPDQGMKISADLGKILDGCLTMTRHDWKSVATIERRYAPDAPQVECYQSSLQQVIINLLINAAHALEQRAKAESVGKITVSTSYNDRFALITVEDNGIGIAEEHLTRIFDPFFTTKVVGKGTGQGLALAHQIVTKQHKGTLSVESKEGVGTSFTVVIPLSQSEVCVEATDTLVS